MSVNKHKPHIQVIPEDDANRQIANGFLLNSGIDQRAIQILPIARGWTGVVERLPSVAREMRRFPDRRVVLVIDFDQDGGRRDYVKSQISPDLVERVFVIGMWSEPEKWKSSNRSLIYEELGARLADGCANDTFVEWDDESLRHNKDEVLRLSRDIKEYLFRKPS